MREIAAMGRILYRRTQPGTALVAIIGVASLVAGGAEVAQAHSPRSAAVVATFLIALAFVFATMTITVTTSHVEWELTFGLLRGRLSIAQIDAVSTARVTLLSGLGIRTNGRDWLWIVSGRDVVVLQRRDGRTIRLGSDDVDGVVAAVQAAIRNQTGRVDT